MKILLDECLPKRLTNFLPGHEVVTVPQAGWSGLKNGKLLTVAQESFDVFLTVDQNLVAQQNTGKYDIAIIVLESLSNDLATLKPYMPLVLALIADGLEGVHKISEP